VGEPRLEHAATGFRVALIVAVAWLGQGSGASSLHTTPHPPYTRFTNIFGASISETAPRPNPRSGKQPQHGKGEGAVFLARPSQPYHRLLATRKKENPLKWKVIRAQACSRLTCTPISQESLSTAQPPPPQRQQQQQQQEQARAGQVTLGGPDALWLFEPIPTEGALPRGDPRFVVQPSAGVEVTLMPPGIFCMENH
jgi:hypothetical protein